MNRRVVITGLGVISSIGIGWQECWKSLLEGKSGISPISSFDTTDHFTHNGGEVKIFHPEQFIEREKLRTMSRATQLGLAASKLAIRDAKLSFEQNKLIAGICIGITMGSVNMIEEVDNKFVRNESMDADLSYQLPANTTAAVIARELRLNGPNLMFSTACAAGNYAIGYGYDLIRFNRADIVLSGGSDPFSRIAFTGFNQLSAVAPEKCQPFDKNRKGMMVAEGAGILVLESLENALGRNAHIYAEVLGYGLSCDANHMTLPSVDGVSGCMLKAMKNAGSNKDDIDYISAHGTGTTANDRTECAAIKEVFGGKYAQIPVSSIKSMLGHTMGAASAIEAIACALILENNIIPPTINYVTPDPECDIDCVPNTAREKNVNIALNNSYAFGGNNASVVLKKYLKG